MLYRMRIVCYIKERAYDIKVEAYDIVCDLQPTRLHCMLYVIVSYVMKCDIVLIRLQIRRKPMRLNEIEQNLKYVQTRTVRSMQIRAVQFKKLPRPIDREHS